MADLTRDLGRCTLLCQTIEFYFFLIVSDVSEEHCRDINSHFSYTASTFVQNWNRTKKLLMDKRHQGLKEELLDAYVIKRNWVIHNLLMDSALVMKDYGSIDISHYVEYFESMESHFRSVAIEFVSIEDEESDPESDRLERFYTKRLAEVIQQKKKIS